MRRPTFRSGQVWFAATPGRGEPTFGEHGKSTSGSGEVGEMGGAGDASFVVPAFDECGPYVDAGRADFVERLKVHMEAGSKESLLLEVLEEVVFTLDTAEAVPMRAEVRVADDAGQLRAVSL